MAATVTAGIGAAASALSAGKPGDSPSAAPHVHGEVSVELKRQGDRISKISIRCRCGEVIELDCEY